MRHRTENSVPNRIPGVLMLVTLAAGLVLSLLNPATLALSGHGALLSGEWMASYQEDYERRLPLRDLAVGVWGLLRYVIFSEGGRGVLIGADDWLFTDEEFRLDSGHERAAERNLQFVREVRDRLQQHDIELVVAVVPAKARIYSDRLGGYRLPEETMPRMQQFRARLADLGIRAPDLEAAMRLARADSEAFLRADTHWTPHGARTAAEALAHAAGPILDRAGSARGSFTLRRGAPLQHRGDLVGFLALGPFEGAYGAAAETVTPYVVEQTDSEPVGLFDEVAIPVTLIGTSYSAGEVWNFDGLLKAELRADVLNLAQEGRGPFIPMQEYLDGPTVLDVPPDLVIWEIPERYIGVAYQFEEQRP